MTDVFISSARVFLAGYTLSVSWDVEYTDEFFAWWEALSESDQRAIDFAVEVLEREGPSLGRPLIDTIRSSRHSNMKELRPLGGSLRVLFAFDPRRIAILLVGGDKAEQWNAWYERVIPVADALYDTHLETLASEGELL